MEKELKSLIEMSLRRHGYNVSVTMSKSKSKYGLYKFVSDEFQTMPIIFDSIHLEGYVTEDVDEPNVLYVSVKLKYLCFCGGTNGTDLYTIKCINRNGLAIYCELPC